MKYISHIDLLRHFTRAFRRAGLDIEFSEGFNPHMLINLGTPLPLGISSSAEYVTVRTVDTDGDTFMERYNRVAPVGLEATKAFTLSVNPNIAGRTVAADYAVKQSGADKVRRDVEGVVNKQVFEMPITKKGETVIKDVAPMVNGIKKGFYMNIAGGKVRKSVLMAEDIARLLPLLEEKGGIYNVCDTRQPTFGEISMSVAKQLGKRRPINIPYWMAWCMAKVGDLLGNKAPINSYKLEKMTKSLTFSNEKARRDLGWEPLDVLENYKI